MRAGTTSVVILAAELLRRANDLVRMRVHPTSIMAGYRLAVKESVKFIKNHLTVSTDKLVRAMWDTDRFFGGKVVGNLHLCVCVLQERDFVVAAAKTSMSSKIIGAHADFFSELAVDAVMSVKRESDASAGAGEEKEEGKSKAKYPVNAINIIKCHGRSSTEVSTRTHACMHA